MIRHCPTCGLETFSIDDLYCVSGCGTFLAALAPPETGTQRRRRLQAQWSDEDRAWDLQEHYRAGVSNLLADQRIELLTSRLTPNQLKKRPIARSAGSSTFSLADLEAGVDLLRLNRDKVTQVRLARECNIGATTLKTWLRLHPGVWDALKSRGRDRI